MSRKISDFFNKKSVNTMSSENDNKSAKSEASVSVKLEFEENLQNLTSSNNLGQENQTRISKNVKTEAEKQLLVISQQERKIKHPDPIKTEGNESKNKFLCKICDKKYSTNYKLNDHVKNIHENPGSFKCKICKIGFNFKSNLNKHQKTHDKNRPKPLKCSRCYYATDSKATLTKHLKTHERIIKKCDKCNKVLRKNKIHECKLDCKYCRKEFGNREYVLNHIKKFHNQETERCFYECDICGLKFHPKINLIKHMETKHADGKIHFFICDLDGKKFATLAQIRAHIKNHLPRVQCDFCPKKLNNQHLKKHIKNSHTGIKPLKKKYIPKIKIFQCQICSKISSSKSNFNTHIGIHNKTIKCKFCEKMFGTQLNLRVHIKNYHENYEGLICNICGKKWTLRSNLSRHLKTHDPNRVRHLKCSQCDYATDEKIKLRLHLNSHKKKNAEYAAIKNPHKCPQCPVVKESKKDLNRHMCRVHPKVLFECDICGRNIKTKQDTLRHFRGFHKIGS